MERFDSMVRGLLLVISIVDVQASCEQGRFGKSCKYSCNCQACDQDTGVCPGSCHEGWVKGGQLCQKQNIAHKKKAWTHRPYPYHYKHWPATNAVDGDNNIKGESSTCFHGESRRNYLAIDLGEKLKIHHIRLYLRYEYEKRISKAKIDDYDHSKVCYTFPSSMPKNPTDVVCDMMAKRITIRSSHAVLNICEVEIYQCSPGTYGEDCNYFCHCSSCNVTSGECTGDCFAGWKGDKCDEACNGTYGINCSEDCKSRHCAYGSSCNHYTGRCDTGCLQGWLGEDCTQKCDSLHYGTNCSRKCMDRYCTDIDSSCNHVSGRCDQGCLPGWRGDDCTQACEPTHYGQNCTRECSSRQCNGVMDCNSASGQCLEGCLSGWNGIDCAEKIERLKVGGYLFVITAVVVGCLAAIVVVIIVVVIIRRRRLLGANRSRKPQAVDNEYADIALEDRGSKSANFERKHIAQQALSVLEQGRSLDTEDAEDTYSVCTRDWDGEEDEGTGGYCNLDEVRRDHFTSIPVSQLLDKISELQKNPKFVEEEYKGLPDGFMHPFDESQTAENNKKNRYKGYYPYNYNRVVLRDVTADSGGDYINASYIDGYQSEWKYIAAQGPYKDHLVIDFWRMLWQEGCKVVVMVTGLVETGRMKCLRYWPKSGSEEYGDVTVTKKSENVMVDFTITALSVQHKVEKKNRQVVHFHFTSWPDHGVPDTSALLSYMSKVTSTAGNQNNPIVVHCSAGIGRTGTYIAVEGLIQQAATEGVVDVVSFVSKMREQRKNMIQTKDQYHFIYRAVASAVLEGDTVLAADDITKIDLRRVGETRMGNRTVQSHLEILKKEHKETDNTNTIQTVSSYRSRSGYLVMTSSPDKEELWEQIYNSGSRSLITWSGSEKNLILVDKTPVSTSRLTVTKEESSELSDNIVLQKLEIKNDGESEGTVLYHYQLSVSVDELNVSALAESLLQWTDRPECRSSTIVSRSVSETRLLVLLLNLISRLQDDGKMDIISDMRRLQSTLPDPRFTVTDVRSCVKLAQQQLESLGVYANL